jgi:hypothetical protein
MAAKMAAPQQDSWDGFARGYGRTRISGVSILQGCLIGSGHGKFAQ